MVKQDFIMVILALSDKSKSSHYENNYIKSSDRQSNSQNKSFLIDITSDEFADIFDDVIYQAVRAISDERLEYLASILEKSLTEEQIKHLQIKRLLSIQDEREQKAMLQNYKDYLVNLGLIGLTHSSSNSTLFLTPLGGMLLKKIGLEKKPTTIGNPISPLSGINAAETRYNKLKQEVDKSKPVKDTFRKSEYQQAQDLAKKLLRGLR